jgi:cysteine dioxygenase
LTLQEKLHSVFGHLVNPTPKELKEALDLLDIRVEELKDYLMEAGAFPYGRKLLFKNEYLEILVMNWNNYFRCAPHDHGNSYGWVSVVKGESTHTIYELKGEIPVPKVTRVEPENTSFFAARSMVHDMENQTDGELVTLHVYSPPISNMKVYDLEKCAMCIVSDDCGAWWPTEQRQRLKEIKLSCSKESQT